MSDQTRPKTELDVAFMLVMVTSNFDDDSIKYERASLETLFSHYKSREKIIRSRAANSVVSGPIRRNSNSTEILCMSLVPANLKKIE